MLNLQKHHFNDWRQYPPEMGISAEHFGQPSIPISRAARCDRKKRPIGSVRVAIACFLIALFLAACDKSSPSSAGSTPKATQKIDLNDLRSKAERGEAQA